MYYFFRQGYKNKMNSLIVKSILTVLLLFPMVNLSLTFLEYNCGNTTVNVETFLLLKEVALLIFVAIAEELFFRGLLLRELIFGYKYKPLKAAILVSALFGVLHIINIFSYASVTYAIIQSLCAFSVSFDLSAIYCKFRSVIPCIVIHALINITSVGLESVNTKLALTNFEASLFLLIAILYLLHGYREFKSMNL